MSRYQQFPVIDPEGLKATLLTTSRFLENDREKLIRTADGHEVLVSNDLLRPMNDSTFRLDVPIRDLLYAQQRGTSAPVESAPAERHDTELRPGEQAVIPAMEERIRVEHEKVETGRIRLHKRIDETSTVVDEPLLQDHYNIERVPINRILTGGPIEARYEGETLVLPVLEEVLVVEKRLVLREEIRVTRDKREVRDPQTHSLRREHIEVERVR